MVAAELGINMNAAYALVKQPGFPSIRIGKRIIIPKEAYNKWLLEAAKGENSEIA